MQYCDRIDLSKGIDPEKSNGGKECIVCHGSVFDHGFEFQDSDCNGGYGLTMLCFIISDIAVKRLVIAVLFITLENLNQFIYQKILYLNIVSIYKN